MHRDGTRDFRLLKPEGHSLDQRDKSASEEMDECVAFLTAGIPEVVSGSTGKRLNPEWLETSEDDTAQILDRNGCTVQRGPSGGQVHK